MENECEALQGVAYPGVRDNRSTLNTKTGYDDDDIRGFPSEYCYAVWHEKTRMAWLPGGE